jgi:hypothetical protein
MNFSPSAHPCYILLCLKREMLYVGSRIRASSNFASYGRLLARTCDVRNNPTSGAKACMHARTLDTHTHIYTYIHKLIFDTICHRRAGSSEHLAGGLIQRSACRRTDNVRIKRVRLFKRHWFRFYFVGVCCFLRCSQFGFRDTFQII